MSETTPGTIDVVRADDFNNLLYRVGNHEGKTAIAALMLNRPEEIFSISSLREAVSSSQGENSAWTPAYPVIKRYCRDDFISTDIIEQSTVGYWARDVQRAQRLAFLGSVLRFSCDFPDTSVQKMFGQTSAGKSHQAPNLRYDICKIVADNEGHEISVADITYLINNECMDSRIVDGAIRALVHEGILNTHVFDLSADVRLRIVDPDFRHRGVIPYDELNPATQLVYRVLRDLSAQGKQDIGFDDLRSHALTLDPNLDLVALRRRWQLAISNKSRNFPGVERGERKIKDPYKNSTVWVRPDQEEAVHTVLHRLNDVQIDPEMAYKEWKFAQNVVKDEAAMSQIFAKAKRFSASAARTEESGEQKEARILKTIQGAGSLTLANLAHQSRTMGQPLTPTVLRRYLKRLLEKGRITQEDKRLDASSKQTTAHYSITPEE